MFKRKNKDSELALLPVSSEDIERVRERCSCASARPFRPACP
jgi:hypothetical protein